MADTTGTYTTRRIAALAVVLLGGATLWWAVDGLGGQAAASDAMTASITATRERAAARDPRLRPAYRFERGGWICVHLEGDPSTIGFQHGYILAPESQDALAAVSAGMM